ncbi:hypothetical protein OIU93_05410 [Paeniglutamicibacter sp. ZC-3]|uniref:hypothetical protein n=1 Tax=Paeniglutamicibacter TaxID=1742990 RepID=UPI0021F6AEA6|nr:MULTISPECIES: hypothetical protein [Paeniglutamicibacter]MCV9993738.1 hypothetical protein [Paeniglutamicibacter sp. ZC-3]MDO2936613.1 hypothetical protein [Paeniglutamicibacter sulfureus]
MFTQSLNAAIAAAESTGGGMSTETQALIVGGSIFVIFMLLLLIAMSYSNVANRHDVKAEPEDTHRTHANKHGHH